MSVQDMVNAVQESGVVRYCREMVRINSVNPPGNERAMAEYVSGVLTAAGLEVEILSHEPSRATILARLRGNGERPALLYSAHLDTVPLGAEKWLHDPFGADMVDGKIWGRGSCRHERGTRRPPRHGRGHDPGTAPPEGGSHSGADGRRGG